jgi:DNA-directed RNA polymerase beta subunit
MERRDLTWRLLLAHVFLARVSPSRVARRLGFMPIMVRSQRCWLHGMSRPELVAAREEANEMGGYFVCNGIERIIRCAAEGSTQRC